MEENNMKKGGISVDTEHIFPIIKRWLYSEKEIFLREIVSNSCDAVTKLKRLSSLGEAHDIDDDFKITVKLDTDDRTITVSDNGIGMTEEELSNYLGKIALSGAAEFIKKYEGTENAADGIIGHFGLGFYSAFMVSDEVDVVTKSYTDAPAVKWTCRESGEYTVEPSDKEERGTDVVMHINEDGEEFLNSAKLRSVLDKYCSFMPVPIFYDDGTKDEADKDKKEEQINDTMPLWMKNPSEVTDEEYLSFYRKVFGDYREPLFRIHINADYPLNFKGILYFPKLNYEYENLEGQVKLYYNGVYVADNIKEVIPDYLLMMRGVLDCPELPLNVSRSYLQNSGYVSKVSAHIVKKVADKLNSMFQTERENFEKIWDDIKLFAEYGCIKDRKFYDRVKESMLFALTDGSHVTLKEYLEKAKEKHEGKVYYFTDKVAQAQYVSMFTSRGIDVVGVEGPAESRFIELVEHEENVKFLRVDSDIADALKGEGEKYENEELAAVFKDVTGNDKTVVTFENLADESVPAVINTPEEGRRMSEMMKMYGMQAPEDTEMSLVLNSNNSLVKLLGERVKNKDESEDVKAAAKQIYSLALLSKRRLTAEEMKEFLASSLKMIERKFDFESSDT